MPSDEQRRSVDTSRMSEGKAAAVEVTESARERLMEYTSFAGSLFLGTVRWPLVFPWPKQDEAEAARGAEFLSKLESVLEKEVDPDEVDRSGEIPESAIDALRGIGAFGVKIPEEFGGLGLSQVTYTRAATLLGSWCANTTALLSAHQSIGVPQPLLLYGTDEQKRELLPRLARGELSAFALTEAKVGSDPARMETTAEPTPDGKHFVINGEKLWCTNGTRAALMVVVARTPDREVDGKKRRQFTAFVVEGDAPGVSVAHRCHFMGLRALYNAVVVLKDVKVPRENILRAEGKGLSVALNTLNTGRLTLPAACVGILRRSLGVARRWAKERVQWGSPIGEHEMIAQKIADMAATTFAAEAMTYLTSALVDGKTADIRIEAAMCKMWVTEAAWQAVNDLLQIRGGRGYETAASLQARGEDPIPVERWVRDTRINLLFEGSSEILRLFLAREALDPHLHVAGDLLDSRASFGMRVKAGLHAGSFYARWYPRQWMPGGGAPDGLDARLAPHAQYVARACRKLARSLFHKMAKFGPKLEERQLLLGRFVDVGTELFAIAACVVRAQDQIARQDNEEGAIALLDQFAAGARLRIRRSLRGLEDNVDRQSFRLAQRTMAGEFAFLEKGIVGD